MHADKKRQKPLYGGWLEDSGNGHYGGGRLGEIGNSHYVEAGLRKAETWIRNQDRRFANLRMRAKLLGSAAEVLFFRDRQRIKGVQHHPTRKQNTTCPNRRSPGHVATHIVRIQVQMAEGNGGDAPRDVRQLQSRWRRLLSHRANTCHLAVPCRLCSALRGGFHQQTFRRRFRWFSSSGIGFHQQTFRRRFRWFRRLQLVQTQVLDNLIFAALAMAFPLCLCTLLAAVAWDRCPILVLPVKALWAQALHEHVGVTPLEHLARD